MDPVSVSVTIARPREEVFEYLLDVANHAGLGVGKQIGQSDFQRTAAQPDAMIHSRERFELHVYLWNGAAAKNSSEDVFKDRMKIPIDC